MSRRSGLRLPHARVLLALLPAYPEDPPEEWPLLTRPMLGARAGYTAVSGTVTRALHGIREGSTSGRKSAGLLELELVEALILHIEGVKEINYRITRKGIDVIQKHIASGVNVEIPIDKSRYINNRYIETTEQD